MHLRHNGLSIRRAVETDIPSIALIERESFADPWSRTAFLSVLREPHSVLAVAVRAAQVVGYSVATYVADEGELANLAVTERARGVGVGRALLDAVLLEGWTRGAAQLFLEVRASNSRALRVYGMAGFREVGRRTRYYSGPVEDAIVMVLKRPDPSEIQVR